MDFSDTDEHRLIRDSVRKVCADFPDEYWAEKDEAHEFPWDFYRAMAAGGWLGIAIPEPYGGSGRGLAEAGIVLEEVAASGAAMNGCSALHPYHRRWYSTTSPSMCSGCRGRIEAYADRPRRLRLCCT